MGSVLSVVYRMLAPKQGKFQPVLEAGSLAESSLFAAFGHLDVMSLIQLGVLALVSLILGLFVIRPILGAKASAIWRSDRS